MKESHLVTDPDGPDEHDYGVIRKTRDEGRYKLYLTYDEPGRMWWIVTIRPEGAIATFGYREDRNIVAWETFFETREWELDQLLDHPHRAHRMHGAVNK